MSELEELKRMNKELNKGIRDLIDHNKDLRAEVSFLKDQRDSLVKSNNRYLETKRQKEAALRLLQDVVNKVVENEIPRGV